MFLGFTSSTGWWCKRSILILIRRPEGAGRGAFYSAGGTARRSFAIDLKRISKRERETLEFLGSVVEPSSARRTLIKNRPKVKKRKSSYYSLTTDPGRALDIKLAPIAPKEKKTKSQPDGFERC
jgi:hypothetical protein